MIPTEKIIKRLKSQIEVCHGVDSDWITITVGSAKRILEILEKEKPVELDIENGITWWFFVCGECHAQVFERDNYCQQCGRRIDWRGTGNKAAGAERVPDDLRSEGEEREQEPGEPGADGRV